MSDDLLPDEDLSRPRPSRHNPLSSLNSLKARLPSLPPQDLTEPAHRLQYPEDVYGYMICAFLFVVGIVLALVHGAGAQKHYNALLPALASVAAVVLGVVIYRFRNRFVSALGSILTAFLILLQRPPTSLVVLWYAAFIFAFVYMFWLTRRQSKAARAQMEESKRAGRGSPRDRRSSPSSSRGPGRKKGKDDEDESTKRPAANKRYTPPQPPKPKRSRNLSADEALAGKTKAKPKAKAKASAASGRRGASDGDGDVDEDQPRRRLLRRHP